MGWIDDQIRRKNDIIKKYKQQTLNPITRGAGQISGSVGFSPPGGSDLEALAREQAEIDKKNVAEQTQANRPNQYTPFGSLTWEKDASGNWTQRMAMNPGDQTNLDSSRDAYQSAFGLAGNIANKSPFGGAKPGISNFDTGLLGNMPGTSSGYQQRAEDAIYGQMTSRLDPQWQRRGEGLENQLRNQGLVPGSEAWTNAMSDHNTARNDAYDMAQRSSIIGSGAEGSRMHSMDAQNFGLGLQGAQTQYGIQQGVHNSWLNDVAQEQAYDINKVDTLAGLAGAARPGMPQMPGVPQAGVASPPPLVGAKSVMDAQELERWKAENKAYLDAIGATTGAIGDIIPSLPGLSGK